MSVPEFIKNHIGGWIAGLVTILVAIVAVFWWADSIEDRIQVLENQYLVKVGAETVGDEPAQQSDQTEPSQSTSRTDPIKQVCADLARIYASRTSGGSEYLSGADHVKDLMRSLGCIE